MYIYFDEKTIYDSVGSMGNLVKLEIDIPETV